jgi:predicted transcriptional regulator
MNAEVVAFILEFNRPFVTPQDIMEEFDCGRSTANERLKEIHNEGEVCRKEIGARAVVYWHPYREVNLIQA